MLWSFCILVACQAAGEAIHAATGLPVPGTILGIGLLVAVLACRGPKQLGQGDGGADGGDGPNCDRDQDRNEGEPTPWQAAVERNGESDGGRAQQQGQARLLALAPAAGAFSSMAMSLTGLLGGIILPICLAHWAK